MEKAVGNHSIVFLKKAYHFTANKKWNPWRTMTDYVLKEKKQKKTKTLSVVYIII